jgi:hypothetical protein
VAVAVDYETRVWPASIAGLLYAVLGDLHTVGALAPYTHTIVPAASLPWATLFGKKDSSRKSAIDCKLDELKIEWDGNAPLKVTPTWAGLGLAYSAIDYVPVLDEALVDYFKGIALATTTIDLDGSGYDGGAKVLGGSVDIKRNLESDIYSGNLLAGDLYEGNLEVDFELKVRVPDLLPVRLLLTGAVGGTQPSAMVPYGDCTLHFVAGTDELTLAATRMAWQTDEPDADPKGGPAELTLKARCYGNPAITATVKNAHATY